MKSFSNTLRDARKTEKRFFVDNVIVLEYGPIIGAYGIAVYNVLLCHSRPDGTGAFPGHQRIAELCDCSSRTVQRSLDVLREQGLLDWQPRYRESGGQTSNEYTIYDPPPRQRVVPPTSESRTPHDTGTDDQSPSNNPPPNKKIAAKAAPLEPHYEFTLTYHYKDDHVHARGRVREGPWDVDCEDCGNQVFVPGPDLPTECQCGLREYVVTLNKPKAEKRERRHAAVEAYYSVYKGRVRDGALDESLEKMIAETVKDLAWFKEVLIAYVGPSVKGNPFNIQNILRYYLDQRLPGTRLTPGGAGGDNDRTDTESIAPKLKAV